MFEETRTKELKEQVATKARNAVASGGGLNDVKGRSPALYLSFADTSAAQRPTSGHIHSANRVAYVPFFFFLFFAIVSSSILRGLGDGMPTLTAHHSYLIARNPANKIYKKPLNFCTLTYVQLQVNKHSYYAGAT